MSDWRDIRTVPKDGRAVVLCWAIDADGKPIDWNKDPCTAGVFVQVASWWCESGDSGEWIVYCSMVRDPTLHFDPTHWMPLPAPPAADLLKGTQDDDATMTAIRVTEEHLDVAREVVSGIEDVRWLRFSSLEVAAIQKVIATAFAEQEAAVWLKAAEWHGGQERHFREKDDGADHSRVIAAHYISAAHFRAMAAQIRGKE